MNMGQQLSRRPCPGCGTDAGAIEIACRLPAEERPFEQLQANWTGLDEDRQFFSYRRCARCGLLYNPVYFSREALAQLYADLPPNMDMVSPRLVARTQQGYLDAIVAAGADLAGDYLEIGPDVGYLAGQSVGRGDFSRLWLFEPNRAVHALLAEAAGIRPIKISEAMDDLSAVPDGSVGLATMIHVLDHLLEPLDLLSQIRRTLRPGGIVAIVTHNEASLLRRALGRRWPPFCLQHPQLFAPATITRLLRRAGFASASVRRARNHFPSDFLLRQAARSLGWSLGRLPMPAIPLRLPLGNMITLARAPVQAAARRLPDFESAA